MYLNHRGLCLKGQPVEHIQFKNYSSKRNDSDKTIDYIEQGNLVMAQVMDLIDDPKYLPYFFKRLNAIGPARFMELAELARKTGLKKGRRFVALLREA
jgi:hypothetical protein